MKQVEVNCEKCGFYDMCRLIYQWTNYDYKREGVFKGKAYKSFIERRKLVGCEHFKTIEINEK